MFDLLLNMTEPPATHAEESLIVSQGGSGSQNHGLESNPKRRMVDVGKLPNQLLAQLLARTGPPQSSRVVVGPGVGQDAAVIDMGDRLLVAKSDPITFASALIGWDARPNQRHVRGL